MQVALDVANGCHYLHRQKPMIVHRDLKSQNILLTRDGRCKIADFGLSKFFQQEVASMTGQIGAGTLFPCIRSHCDAPYALLPRSPVSVATSAPLPAAAPVALQPCRIRPALPASRFPLRPH